MSLTVTFPGWSRASATASATDSGVMATSLRVPAIAAPVASSTLSAHQVSMTPGLIIETWIPCSTPASLRRESVMPWMKNFVAE